MLRAIAFIAVAPVLLAGCAAGTHTLDGAVPIPLRVSTTATTVDIDAPGWYAAESTIYLCPSPPPPLPDATADRRGWTPGGGCHDYGRRSSGNGLTASLPIADLEGGGWPAFQAAPDWYVLVLQVDGDLVVAATRSQFHAPPIAAGS